MKTTLELAVFVGAVLVLAGWRALQGRKPPTRDITNVVRLAMYREAQREARR